MKDAQQDVIEGLRMELTAHKEALAVAEETISGIAGADWRTFWNGSTSQDFVDWAKSRCRNTLDAIAKCKEGK